jgi:hypothetical protein
MRAISLRTDRLPAAMVRAQSLDRVIEAAWERASRWSRRQRGR